MGRAIDNYTEIMPRTNRVKILLRKLDELRRLKEMNFIGDEHDGISNYDSDVFYSDDYDLDSDDYDANDFLSDNYDFDSDDYDDNDLSSDNYDFDSDDSDSDDFDSDDSPGVSADGSSSGSSSSDFDLTDSSDGFDITDWSSDSDTDSDEADGKILRNMDELRERLQIMDPIDQLDGTNDCQSNDSMPRNVETLREKFEKNMNSSDQPDGINNSDAKLEPENKANVEPADDYDYEYEYEE